MIVCREVYITTPHIVNVLVIILITEISYHWVILLWRSEEYLGYNDLGYFPTRNSNHYYTHGLPQFFTNFIALYTSIYYMIDRMNRGSANVSSGPILYYTNIVIFKGDSSKRCRNINALIVFSSKGTIVKDKENVWRYLRIKI